MNYEKPELFNSVLTENKYIKFDENRNYTEKEKNEIIKNTLTIENKNFVLTPSKYIKFVDKDLGIDYEKEMSRIQTEMKTILKNERESQKKLCEAFEGIGYGIE